MSYQARLDTWMNRFENDISLFWDSMTTDEKLDLAYALILKDMHISAGDTDDYYEFTDIVRDMREKKAIEKIREEEETLTFDPEMIRKHIEEAIDLLNQGENR